MSLYAENSLKYLIASIIVMVNEKATTRKSKLVQVLFKFG